MLERLEKIVGRDERIRCIQVIIESIGGENAAEAIRLVDEAGLVRSEKETAAYHMAELAVEESPAQALAVGSALPPGLRSKFAHALAGRWPVKNPGEFYGWMRDSELSGAGRDKAFLTFTERVAAEDPDLALSYLSELPANESLDKAFGHVAESYQRAKPAEALEWALGLDHGRGQNFALAAIFEAKTKLDPLASINELYSLGLVGEQREKLAKLVVHDWALNEPRKVIGWIDSQELPAPERAFLMDIANRTWAVSDYAGFLENVRSSGGETEESSAVTLALSRFSSSDPASAAAWMSESGALTSQRARTLVQRWSKHDPKGASRWIAGIEDVAVRDPAVVALVEDVLENDPESAYLWANSITDSSTKERYLGDIEKYILRNRPDLAPIFDR
ncbi:hypothetical protein BH23VER1_BH23VER1_35170 [soil metagenome]